MFPDMIASEKQNTNKNKQKYCVYFKVIEIRLFGRVCVCVGGERRVVYHSNPEYTHFVFSFGKQKLTVVGKHWSGCGGDLPVKLKSRLHFSGANSI